MDLKGRILNLPFLKTGVAFLKKIKLPWLQGLTLFDLIELYGIGITEGALSNRAGSIAFSFFMALFPFALFILNLLPYIPIEGFQADFLKFVSEGVPPNTYSAIASIIDDILHNSHSGLISWGFLLSILLMANGLNAILGGFENSRHVVVKRNFFQQYVVAVGLSVVLSIILLLTVAIIVVFEVFIQKLNAHHVLSTDIIWIILGRYASLVLMILITISILFKFGTKDGTKGSFISIGSVFTTVLIIISSYFFGIWVVRFSQYNQLYGSIGTLLIVMFYIWINCLILLLGFELNAAINKLSSKENG